MDAARFSVSLGLVGTGRVAWALGRAARASGVNVDWVAGRTPARGLALAEALRCPFVGWEPRPPAGLTVIAVSDDALDAVAADLAATASEASLAVHTCGARGREALAPLSDAGWTAGAWHPLQAFATTGTELIPGVTFAISAPEGLAETLIDLTTRLGGRPLALDDAARARYHAAAAMAANYTGVLLYHAAELLAGCGLGRPDALAALLPLVSSTLTGIEASGLPGGLTGPASRGDAGTIRRHLTAIADAPDAEALYRAAGLATLPLLVERGLPESSRDAVRAALSDAAGRDTSA